MKARSVGREPILQGASIAALALVGCASAPTGPCPAPLPPVLVPMPMPATSSARSTTKVAVLPLEEDELFRAERAQLRAGLAAALGRVAPELTVVPLADVDAKLAPVSRKTGARCAFEEAPIARATEREGWSRTSVFDVSAFEGRQAELWVVVNGFEVHETFTAPWSADLDPIRRYEAAFASLRRDDAAGLLGGLGSRPKYAAGSDGVSFCEGDSFECAPESKSWVDQSSAIARCFEGSDESSMKLLLDASTTPARCEAANLDDVGGARGKREACLCDAARASSAIGRTPKRRRLAVAFQAPDISGKPRPTVRVVEATTNVFSDSEWTSVDGGRSVRRLAIDGDDGIAPAITRCAAAPGSLLVLDLTLDETGHVDGVREAARTPPGSTTMTPDALGSCVDKALRGVAFACTNDGKPAAVRLELAWR